MWQNPRAPPEPSAKPILGFEGDVEDGFDPDFDRDFDRDFECDLDVNLGLVDSVPLCAAIG